MSGDNHISPLRQTVKVSNLEGVFAQISGSLSAPGSIFLTKFVVMLGARPFHFSLISAISQLSQVFQLLGIAITHKIASRKNAVVSLTAFGRAMAFLYGLLPFILLPKAMSFFIPLLFLSTSLQAIGGNIWIAWISDMVPLRMRGRFFSRRFQYLMLTGLLTGYIAGFFLDLFESPPGVIARAIISITGKIALFRPVNLPYAFIGIFTIAAIIGLIGTKILATQPDRPPLRQKETFPELFSTPLRDKNFRRLLGYGLWWMLAVGIASPFWQPFMIKKLGMSLVNIQLYGTISTLSGIAVLPAWGILIDRFGNKTAMRLAILLGGLNPMVWLFVTPQNYWPIYLEAATSGIMWSGTSVITTNFVLAIAPDQRRQVYSGIFGAFSGMAMMITMLFSGIFLPPPIKIFGIHLEPEQVLFGLTGLARWSTQIPLSWITEPKAKPVGEMLYFFWEFTKVRITQFGDWLFPKR